MLLGGAVLTLSAALDVIIDLGWGFRPGHAWIGLLIILFGGVFWLFARLISGLGLTLIRRLYGPEPDGPNDE